MRCVSHFFILLQILILVSIAGCAKPSLPEIGAITEVYGSPYIVHNNVFYYIGPWQPGAVVLKIHYKETAKQVKSELPGFRYIEGGDPYYHQVTSIESEYIEEDDLSFYIPLLINSLKDTSQGGKGMRALNRLVDIMYICFPNGYGDYYMHPTENPYTGTPFADRNLKIDETTYKKWKEWWEKEGHKMFP